MRRSIQLSRAQQCKGDGEIAQSWDGRAQALDPILSLNELPQRSVPKRQVGLRPLASVDRDTLEAIPAAIAFFGSKGEILRNRTAADLLSPYGQVDNAAAPRFIAADGRTDAIRLALSDGLSVHDLELIVERPDGTRLELLLDLEPLTGQDAAAGAIACFRDMTDAKRAIEAALAQQQDLEDFLRTVRSASTSFPLKGLSCVPTRLS